MKFNHLTLILILSGLFLIGCSKKTEDSVTTYAFNGDYKAGEVLSMDMLQQSSFTLSNNTPLAMNAKDFVKGDIFDEDVNNYIGQALERDVKQNDALTKSMFINPD